METNVEFDYSIEQKKLGRLTLGEVVVLGQNEWDAYNRNSLDGNNLLTSSKRKFVSGLLAEDAANEVKNEL